MKKWNIAIIILIIIVIIGIVVGIALNENKQTSENTVDELTDNNIQVENNIEESAGNENMEEVSNMRISVKDNNNHTIIFELNDSSAATSLYEQLPLTINVENYSNNEKIFYPTNKLNTDNTPITGNDGEGTLAYYAPWGDVVMFYNTFNSASGLYQLGKAVEGTEQIRNLSGNITIEKIED